MVDLRRGFFASRLDIKATPEMNMALGVNMGNSVRSNFLAASFVGICLLCAATTFGANSPKTLAQIKDQGSISIGMDIPYGVMEYLNERGQPSGIDVDIAAKIAAALDVQPKFEPMPFDDLFGALKEGSVDLIISAITITQERQKTMTFSVPYMDTGLSVAVPASDTMTRGIEDLAGKSVGVLSGTTGEQYALESHHINNDLVRRYQDNDRRLNELKTGALDAAIVHFLSKPPAGIKVVGEPLTQSFYGVVARPESTELLAMVNSVLRDLKRSGELERIKDNHIKKLNSSDSG